jgi:ferredoxin
LKIAIHYFTGTGNTAHAARLMTDRLHAEGHQVNLRRVRRGARPPRGRCDLHIFAFPVLAWSAPVMMKRYLRALPRRRGAAGVRAAVLAVNGGMMVKGAFRKGFSGRALEQAAGILRRRGCVVFRTASASFPENWTQCVNPPTSEEAEAAFPLGEAEVHDFLEGVSAGDAELFRCPPMPAAWTGVLAWLFGSFGRRLLGKAYIADERCDACGLCAATCPALTIRMRRRRPRWGAGCEDCNRCINICPREAIQVSLPLLFAHLVCHVWLTAWSIRVVPAFIPVLAKLPSHAPTGLKILLGIAAVYFFLWVNLLLIDPLLQLLARLPVLRPFFRLSHTRRFRRYTAPGFKPRRD